MLLERILRNLLENAIRYTEQGGILLGVRVRGADLRIEVWDTGVGIAESERETIFEAFYQVGNVERHRKRGLGLGLAITRRLTTLLGYRLDLESRLGRGSMFAIIVPRGERREVEPPPAAETAITHGVLAGKAILVIDDDTDILEATRALLSTWQCEAIAAESVAAALHALGTLGRYPDLIIADYRLHGGQTGVVAIQQIREELGFAVPALVLTGSTAPDLALELEAAGLDYVYKPVVPQSLLTAIRAKLLT